MSFTWHYKFCLAIHFHPYIGYLPAKIKICYHSSAEESAKNQDTIPLFRRRVSKRSRYVSTLPQKSQQKVKIRFHSSAEESVFQAGGWRIFPQKIYILWGWRIFPQSNFTLVGLTHIPPHQIFMGLTQFPQSWVIMWSKVFPMLGCAWWCIVPRDSQSLCKCFYCFFCLMDKD